MNTIIQFLSNILDIPDRYDFIFYIVAGVLTLILIDGIISFFLSGISDLISRR